MSAQSTTAQFDVSIAAGLPETVLPADLVERLPDPASIAPAPWATRCQVVSWLHPVGPEVLELVPASVRPAEVSVVAWALVRYDETPVGPYSEIAATLLADDGVGHIPFIVVDSLTSIVGGRVNWLLPKALAEFAWNNDFSAVTVTPVEPTAPYWSISVNVGAFGDPTDLAIPSRLRQASTSGLAGSCEASMSGAMRSARVTVDGHADGPLAALLQAGTFDATMQTNCEFTGGPLVS